MECRNFRLFTALQKAAIPQSSCEMKLGIVSLAHCASRTLGRKQATSRSLYNSLWPFPIYVILLPILLFFFKDEIINSKKINVGKKNLLPNKKRSKNLIQNGNHKPNFNHDSTFPKKILRFFHLPNGQTNPASALNEDEQHGTHRLPRLPSRLQRRFVGTHRVPRLPSARLKKLHGMSNTGHDGDRKIGFEILKFPTQPNEPIEFRDKCPNFEVLIFGSSLKIRNHGMDFFRYLKWFPPCPSDRQKPQAEGLVSISKSEKKKSALFPSFA